MRLPIPTPFSVLSRFADRLETATVVLGEITACADRLVEIAGARDRNQLDDQEQPGFQAGYLAGFADGAAGRQFRMEQAAATAGGGYVPVPRNGHAHLSVVPDTTAAGGGA